MVDVYSYVAEQHIQAKKTLRVVIGGEYMDLDWKALKKPAKKSEPFTSKWNAGKVYTLYSYPWKPIKIEEPSENPYSIKFTYK
jgi:hypothetical protein